MIQRFLKNALDSGIAAIKADTTILDELFAEVYELPEDEVEAIKTIFTTQTPRVHHGYARSDYDFPLYSIVLASEAERTHFIGDDVGMVTDELDEDFGADIKGSIWEHSYQILTYAEHPDVTLYLYEVAKNILLSAGYYFDGKGMFETDVSGMDLAPDPRYIPENLFVRQIMFKCQREFCLTEKESKLGKAFKVAGIHVDKSGSSGDVGGVKTLVTISGLEEED